MAVGVIVDVPARHHDDGHRVVARDMEMVEQGAPEIATVGGGGQEGLQLGHEETVETDRHHEGEQCGQPLFALDGEQMAQGTGAGYKRGMNQVFNLAAALQARGISLGTGIDNIEK